MSETSLENTGGTERDCCRASAKVQVGEAEERIRRLSAEKEDLARLLLREQERSSSAQDRVEELTRLLAEHEEQVKHANSELKKLQGRAKALESLVNSQKRELDIIRGSTSWRLVQHFWNWNVHAFPFGSRRRAVYDRAARLLFRGGPPRIAGEPGNVVRAAIRFHCDEPQPGQRCFDTVTIRGYALAPPGIEAIEVYLDGELLGNAIYGQLRADVARDFPTFKGAENSGFRYLWDTTHSEDGPHEIKLKISVRDGSPTEYDVPIIVDHSLSIERYQIWIEVNEPFRAELEEQRTESAQFAYRPLISILTPAFRTPTSLLRAAIDSVLAQTYQNWQLCLADDGSRRPELIGVLKEYAEKDSRIVFTELPENRGIAEATNAALALASGEFVGFLDHDDTVSPDALYWVVKELQENRDFDLIYSDEDKLDPAGKRFDPFFKPSWSPDLLLSMNYICHFVIARRHLVQRIGGLRPGFDGAQDYEFLLRLTEQSNRIRHIPRVLYHWRQISTSTAASGNAKPMANEAARRAISEHLQRTNVSASVEPGIAAGRWRVRYEIAEHPNVAIVLPTGGRLQLLTPCLDSLFANTEYPNFQVLLVDNSKNADVSQYIRSLRNEQVSYIDWRNRPFNYSALNNYAVQQTQLPLILFLNDDTTIVKPDWLHALVEHAQRPLVGAVGAKLVYPFGLIQHAGVIMGVYENTAHAFRNLPQDSRTHFDFPQIIRNCSAVTAACMMTKRDPFLKLGGFNESRLPVAFQDVDYCLRLCAAGYFVVYTPYCELIHHESVTKDEKLGNPKEVRYMQQQWAEVIANDPFYSPNLTRKGEDYNLRMD